ncbi:DUF7718 family protein [Thermus scotoductus]|uniref:DUF7718 family protein n=1 Tax=Thermus scotoductus TaxID=37636 RepID=UPI001562BB6C|nr:hypothetical protein [Thermus scotoductus]
MVRRREVVIGPDRRLRVTLEVERGKLRSWAVQLEWWDPEDGRWVWVVRYDTAGGKGHRDRNRIAAHEPVDLPEDPGRAAKVAEKELSQRAEEYIEAYRAAKAQGR